MWKPGTSTTLLLQTSFQNCMLVNLWKAPHLAQVKGVYLYAQVQASGFRVKMQTNNLFHIHASMMHQSHWRECENLCPAIYPYLLACPWIKAFTSYPIKGCLASCRLHSHGHEAALSRALCITVGILPGLWMDALAQCPQRASFVVASLQQICSQHVSLLLLFNPIKLFIFSSYFLLRVISSVYFSLPIE